MMNMAEIYEHVIHRFLRERGGSAAKKEIYKDLGDDEASRRMIDDKLRMMERFGLVIIDEEEVRVK
jgi:DNA-binding HxlR family transcriptional regulator